MRKSEQIIEESKEIKEKIDDTEEILRQLKIKFYYFYKNII